MAHAAGDVSAEDAKTLEEIILSATHPLLKTPDWGANMVIVDMLQQNKSPEMAARVLKAIRPRVTHSDPKIGLLAIALLESLVKNCPSFHPYVAQKEFLKEIVKTVPKKVRDPQSRSLFRMDSATDVNSVERTDRVLVVIQSWAIAFGPSKQYPAFHEIYNDLIGKGCKFPEPSNDETAPVFTPPVHIPKPPVAPAAAKPGRYVDADCRACAESAELLDSMLTASDPSIDLTRHDLIPDLVKAMHVAQNKLLTRATAGNASDALMAELLAVNDAMLTAIRYYDGLVAGTMSRKKPQAAQPQAQAASNSSPSKDRDPKKEDSKPRIDSKQQPQSSPAAASSPDPFESVSPAKPTGQSSAVRLKKIPMLAPPSSNNQKKGRHGGSVSSPPVSGAAAPASGAAPVIDLMNSAAGTHTPTRTPPTAAAAAPAPVRKDVDLSEFFFGGSAAAATPAASATPIAVNPPLAPFNADFGGAAAAAAPVATANGARAASILDMFLGKPTPTATPAPAPTAAVRQFPNSNGPQAVPVPIPTRQLQPLLAAHYAPPQPAAAAANTTSLALDDDPFAAFAASRESGAAAAPSGAANTTLDENPFDELAKRGL